MSLTVIILVLGLLFLGHYTGRRLLNVGGSIILMSQIFVVEDSIIVVGLIFVVLYETYYTFFQN